MNERTKDFAKMLADTILQGILWERLKKDWWEPFHEEKLYIDENENILAIKTEGSVMVLGYLHLACDLHIQPDFQNTILQGIIDFVASLDQIINDKGWKDHKIIVVTTYKLSDLNKFDYSILPDHVSYFFMTESQDSPKKKYNMRLDKKIHENNSGYIMLKYLLDNSEKMLNDRPESWSCDICGGSNNTGCLYFDPTECPKFT